MRRNTFLGRIGTVCLMSLGYQVIHIAVLIFLGAFLFSQANGPSADKLPKAVAIVEGQPVLWRPYTIPADGSLPGPDGQPVKLRDKQAIAIGADLFPNNEVIGQNSTTWGMQRLMIEKNETEPWYLIQERIAEDSTAYLVAYSNYSRTPTRYIGALGQLPTVPLAAQRFQLLRGMGAVLTDEGQQPSGFDGITGYSLATTGHVSLLTKSGLEAVDLRLGKVTRVVSASDLSNLAVAGRHEILAGKFHINSLEPSNPILVRGPDTVYEVKHEKITSKYTIPESLTKIGFTAYPVDAGTIYYATNVGIRYRWTAPRNLLKCNAAGEVLKTWEIEQPPDDPYAGRSPHYLATAAMFPTPLQIVGSLLLMDPTLGIDRIELVQDIWLSFLLTLACGIICTIAAWRLAPRFSGGRPEWGWLVFVFVFGLPGLVGYLMHFRRRARPVLEPVARLGTEIFA